jgi:hypothetical protein
MLLPFSWNEPHLLPSELAKEVMRASIQTIGHNRPIALTLWRSDGTGLCIRSKMHDVAERLEVGVLDFTLTTQRSQDEEDVLIPGLLNGPISVSKLVITESGTQAESGLVLTPVNGEQIIVLASVYPYGVAIKGLVHQFNKFDPEYPLIDYTEIFIWKKDGIIQSSLDKND